MVTSLPSGIFYFFYFLCYNKKLSYKDINDPQNQKFLTTDLIQKIKN